MKGSPASSLVARQKPFRLLDGWATLTGVRCEAGDGEHGVDAVAISAFEIIATHPITGSTAARRRISRRMALATRRSWPLIQTLNRSG
jgi:hypothetical protein